MEDIKVGEYVRTRNNGIKRIDTILKNKTVNKYGYEIGSEWDGKLYSIIKTTEIVKHSKNIIDLIEVGDYVNGKKIDTILDGGFKSEGVAERVLCFEIDFPIEKGLRAYHNHDIKSIVTKEQFANIEYKLNT